MPGLSLSPAAVESISLRAREHLTERELPRESVAVPEFSLPLLETRALQGKSVGAHLCMLRMQLSSGTSGHHMTLLKSSTLRGGKFEKVAFLPQTSGEACRWDPGAKQVASVFGAMAPPLLLGFTPRVGSYLQPSPASGTRQDPWRLVPSLRGRSLHMKAALLGELDASFSDDRPSSLAGQGSSLTCWKGFGHSPLTRCQGGRRSLLQVVEAVTPVHRL